jgi:hypothetical protein
MMNVSLISTPIGSVAISELLRLQLENERLKQLVLQQ